jgi:hypothetical protein
MNNLERERLVPVSETDGIPSERGGSHPEKPTEKPVYASAEAQFE